jgi:hypothetical protein
MVVEHNSVSVFLGEVQSLEGVDVGVGIEVELGVGTGLGVGMGVVIELSNRGKPCEARASRAAIKNIPASISSFLTQENV